MGRVRFISYGKSSGCKDLSLTVEGKRLKLITSFVPRENDLIINWGSTRQLPWNESSIPYLIHMLNHPLRVQISGNKLKSFDKLSSVDFQYLPEYTINKEVARQWILEGATVFCRTLLRSKGGGGIALANSEEALVDAPLYTKAFNTKSEYRVHVFRGEVIDFTKKGRRSGEQPNRLIRNYSNGWVFIRNGIELPEVVKECSLRAVELLGLDFGGVDVGYNSQDNTACFFEINTAPGLQGSTLTKYAEAIKEYLTTING